MDGLQHIAETFTSLRAQHRAALMPYFTLGYPTAEASLSVIEALANSGADLIELGVPFSDPLADGATIQRAAIRGLASKTNLKGIFAAVKRVRTVSQVPIILMLYYNLVFKYGETKFARDAAAAGVDGVIIPDLPPDEADELIEEAEINGLDTIFLLAPTSDADRIKLVSQSSTGFIYYVSLTGVTGERAKLDAAGIKASIAKIRKKTKLPISVGFGISTPEQAAQVAALGDGVIVGSAIVSIMEKDPGEAAAKVGEFVRGLKAGVLSAKK
ncbi:MAG TPA: tryptophan synthase subunit alpha, partial [Nitrospirota bacterium]